MVVSSVAVYITVRSEFDPCVLHNETKKGREVSTVMANNEEGNACIIQISFLHLYCRWCIGTTKNQ